MKVELQVRRINEKEEKKYGGGETENFTTPRIQGRIFHSDKNSDHDCTGEKRTRRRGLERMNRLNHGRGKKDGEETERKVKWRIKN